jgi:hypothetical protein
MAHFGHKQADELRSSPVCRSRIADVWICRIAMTLAQWLSRLCGIDIETCSSSGVTVRIVACIKDPNIIEKIFTHLDAKVAEPQATRRPPCRAPPHASLIDGRDGPKMNSFGLWHQRRGNGVACPANRLAGEKCAGEAVFGKSTGL